MFFRREHGLMWTTLSLEPLFYILQLRRGSHISRGFVFDNPVPFSLSPLADNSSLFFPQKNLKCSRFFSISPGPWQKKRKYGSLERCTPRIGKGVILERSSRHHRYLKFFEKSPHNDLLQIVNASAVLPGVVRRHDLCPDILVPEQLGLLGHHVLLRARVCHLRRGRISIHGGFRRFA